VVGRRVIVASALQHLTDWAALAPHVDALVAQGPPAWADASSLFLADAAGAVAGAVEDKGWFGTGLLKGVDPWGTWRGFIQGSIVATHDFLVAQGVKENAWGLALMLFTFSLRALTLPLTWFQFASTEKQKALAVRAALRAALVGKQYAAIALARPKATHMNSPIFFFRRRLCVCSADHGGDQREVPDEPGDAKHAHRQTLRRHGQQPPRRLPAAAPANPRLHRPLPLYSQPGERQGPR
jgi:hypothetical protein